MTQPVILDRIFKLAIPSKPNVQSRDESSSPQTKNAQAHRTRQRDHAPYPGAARIFDRPFQRLSGRRHIPVLVNANKVPFLRIKKPQPPSLSRMIGQTARTREHRLQRASRLATECLIAQDEDEWDQLHYENFGLDYGQADEQSWEYEVKLAFDTNRQQQFDALRKRADIAAEMYAIIEQEKALAKKEKDEKKQARWARWLARRKLTEIENQETLHPQPEETIREVEVYPSPGETFRKPVPDQSYEEGHQPDMEQVSHKRSANFKTRDETRHLYEASLLPRTDEEIAKIKEARIRRRDEKREWKAQKSKRRQENAAVHEQALRRKEEERQWKVQKPKRRQENAAIQQHALGRKEDEREWEAQSPWSEPENAAVQEQALRRKGVEAQKPWSEHENGPLLEQTSGIEEEERAWKAQNPWAELEAQMWELRLRIDNEATASKDEYRRQERGEFWEQTLHRDGKGSTNNQQGSYISRLQEELQGASGLVSDTRLGSDQTEDQHQGIFRPSLLRKEPKNPQQKNQI